MKPALMALLPCSFAFALSCATALSPAPTTQTPDQDASMPSPQIPGYLHGSAALPPSPVTVDELAELQTSLLFGEDDVAALRMSLEVLRPQVDEILDVWYGFVGSTPHLLAYFSDPSSGAPDAEYLAAVRKRFGQWILDTASAEYDADWLAWQHEIGLRHHSAKKNRTDGGKGPDIVHFRHMVALTIPVTTTLKPFLAAGDHSPEEVDAMHQAWVKSVLLQVILWSHPYVRAEEF